MSNHIQTFRQFNNDDKPIIRWDSFYNVGNVNEKLHVTYTFHGNIERMLPAGVTKSDVEYLLNVAYDTMIQNHKQKGPTKFLIRDRRKKYAIRGVFGVNKEKDGSAELIPREDNSIMSNLNKSNRKEGFIIDLRPEKGFGFIRPVWARKDDNADIYFHKSKTHVTKFDELKVGDVVEYQKAVDQANGKDMAIKVTLMDNTKLVVVGELMSFDQYNSIINKRLDHKYDNDFEFHLQNRLRSIKEPVEKGDWVYDVITVNAKTAYTPNTPTDIVIDVDEDNVAVKYINGKWK